MYYKKFNFEYNKKHLLNIFNCSILTPKQVYLHATNIPTDMLPCINIFGRDLTINEYGLSKIVRDTGFHINPGNNGLILFPVNGIVRFRFVDEVVDADSPIIINGRQNHSYEPTNNDTIFFAIKIPSSIKFEEVIKLVSMG